VGTLSGYELICSSPPNLSTKPPNESADHTVRSRATHPLSSDCELPDKFQQTLQHKKDEMVQAGPDELDPLQWSGNQRVLHFGPMAQRDPFFYYYPKGWDILYPAQFGFFPYRTRYVWELTYKENIIS